MNHILTHLTSKGAPNHSLVAALNHYAWGDQKAGGEFLGDLKSILTEGILMPPFQHEMEIELTYKCLLEIGFKDPKADLHYALQEHVNDAYHRAKNVLIDMPHLKAEKEQAFGAQKAPVATKTISVENQDGTKTELKVKQKKEAALEVFKKLYKPDQHEATRAMVIEKFMTDLDMGKPGATTYFHNFKSGTWK